MDLGIGWEGGGEKTLINGAVWDRLALAKPLAPYKFFIIMAMAAIGLNTDLIKLVRTGGRPILMGLCCWAAITAVSLGMQYALDLW